MLKGFDSSYTKGRRKPYDEDLLIHHLDPFMSDYLKIIQSKAFRRLAYKAQVLCFPENPHIRTRSLHTNEVISFSSTISENLGLNTNLCQAIAAGHDIGHTPYGHLGEKVLTEITGKNFKHRVFSLVVAQHIERKGFGLNLSYETLEGILCHSRDKGDLDIRKDVPDEYNVVMYSDKIVYTFSDINDAIRYNYMDESTMKSSIRRLGDNQRQRINTCIQSLIDESLSKGKVSFQDSDTAKIFNDIRDSMFNDVYEKIDLDLNKLILKKVYDFFNSPSFLEELNLFRSSEDKSPIISVDPVIATALLTDREANCLGEFLIKTQIPSISDIRNFGVLEILPYIDNKNIDPNYPDISWQSYY